MATKNSTELPWPIIETRGPSLKSYLSSILRIIYPTRKQINTKQINTRMDDPMGLCFTPGGRTVRSNEPNEAERSQRSHRDPHLHGLQATTAGGHRLLRARVAGSASRSRARIQNHREPLWGKRNAVFLLTHDAFMTPMLL